MQKNTILIVGGDGIIGKALADHLKHRGESVFETTRRPDNVSGNKIFLDLADYNSNWYPPDHVSVAIICAGITSLQQCKNEPEMSATVNVYNTVALVKALVANGIFVIFLSTNLVYDGSIPFRKSDDSACPNTEYGRQKAETEKELLHLGELVSVVRFTKILGPNMPLFQNWIETIQNNRIIHPFTDMVMAPVPLSYAINVLQYIAKKRISGIIQVSGNHDVTYSQVAYYIVQHIDANSDLVKPLSSGEAGVQLEALAAHTTLDTKRLREELGIEPPDVWKSIDGILDTWN